MQENDPNPGAEPSELQFERAEYSEATSAAALCHGCKQPIAGSYYMLGQAMICPQCHAGFTAQLESGSRAGRFFGALSWGLLAAIAGGLAWFAVRKTTGYEIGLVAVAVGLLVGSGVRRGARRRGGWVYQTMAVVLTYGCITGQYMPDILQMVLKDVHAKERVAATQPATNSSAMSSGLATSPNGTSSTRVPRQDIGPGKAILLLLAGILLLFVIALLAPILAGFQNIIGLLIIGFALYEAWKLNKRRPIPLSGPFMLPPPGPSLRGA